MSTVLLILFYILTPLLINYFNFKYKAVSKIGPIIFAYLVGLIVGNIGLFPEAGSFMLKSYIEGIKFSKSELAAMLSQGMITAQDIRFYQLKQVQDIVTTITIPIALPLLLFSMNIRSWFKIAGKTFLSLILGVISVIVPIIIGFFLFKDHTEESWKIAGMMAGVYTGGTPNLAAIKTALHVSSETYVLTHTYDLIIGVLFLSFVMTIGQRLFNLFLPAYRPVLSSDEESVENRYLEKTDSFLTLLRKEYLLPLLSALGISVLIFVIGGILSLAVPQKSQMVTVILTITTLGILVSLIPKINRIKKTFDLGMYFILVFSIVVASMADIRNFSTAQIEIFYWIALVYGGSLIIHVALSAIFKIDSDNVIIVSTALTCSPPFVPVVAAALKNKEIIISGITVGIIGYAIGNYLGITIAFLLKNWFY